MALLSARKSSSASDFSPSCHLQNKASVAFYRAAAQHKSSGERGLGLGRMTGLVMVNVTPGNMLNFSRSRFRQF